MNINEYIEENKDFLDNDIKIAYFKMGFIIRKLFKKMSLEEKANFTRKQLKGLDWRYLKREHIIYKLVPKLTYLNEEYNLHYDNLLTDIAQTIISTVGLKGLINADPVVYISLGMNLPNTFDDFIGIKEATEIFNKAESTLRLNIKNGKFIEGVDCKKYGNSWIFSIDALEREYGER